MISFIKAVHKERWNLNDLSFDRVSQQAVLSSVFERILASTNDCSNETSCFDCPAHSSAEDLKHYQQVVADYIAQVVGAYQLCYQEFLSSLPACAAPGFADDFRQIEHVLTQTHDLVAAEKALSFWEGAVNDDTLRGALIGLRYVYLTSGATSLR